MKLKPMWDYVLLEREKLKATGIIIPESAEKRNARARGVVLAVGPSCEPEIKALVGKLVIIGQYAGDWIKAPDGEYYVCKETDILVEVENG